MSVYYNENDARAAAWLRALIAKGVLPDGEVDTRSIIDVGPEDLAGFRQCHFFAGIGGWAYALQLAGWPVERSCWTGSCPCQPFSMAGKGAGTDDPRHLWPAWFRLIEQRRPAAVFGEQVASADGLYWLDLVYADLEAAGYAVAAVDLPACSVGAPHRRNRLWFVADDDRQRREQFGAARLHDHGARGHDVDGRGGSGGMADAGRGGRAEPGDPGVDPARGRAPQPAGRGPSGGVADADRHRAGQHAGERAGDESAHEERAARGADAPVARGAADDMADAEGRGLGADRRAPGPPGHAEQRGEAGGAVANADDARREGHRLPPLRRGRHRRGPDERPAGPPSSGSPAATAKRGRLNPAHSRWLMGYPPAWDACAAMAMPSSPSSPPK